MWALPVIEVEDTGNHQTWGQLNCNWNANSNSGIGVLFLKVIALELVKM